MFSADLKSCFLIIRLEVNLQNRKAKALGGHSIPKISDFLKSTSFLSECKKYTQI